MKNRFELACMFNHLQEWYGAPRGSGLQSVASREIQATKAAEQAAEQKRQAEIAVAQENSGGNSLGDKFNDNLLPSVGIIAALVVIFVLGKIYRQHEFTQVSRG